MSTLSRGRRSAPPLLPTVLALSLGLGMGLIGTAAAPASAVRTTVSSSTGVTISDAVDIGSSSFDVNDDATAVPYPSPLDVTNTDVVTDVDVYLNDVNHGRASDLDVLLVGPGGQQVTVMSDAGGDHAVTNAYVVFDDEAAAPLPSDPVADGLYRPTDLGGEPDTFPVPAPAGSGNTSLSVLDGTSAAGTWSLYVVDDATGESGTVASWSLTIRTKSDPYPSSVTVSGLGSRLFDLDVTLKGLTHTYPDDLDVLLVGPGGQRTRLTSDVGDNDAVTDVDLTFDDEATDELPDQDIVTGSYKPTDRDEDGYPDNFDPAPAPTSGTSLSYFDGTDPNGTWSLYVTDDAGVDVGTLVGWSLDIETDGSAPTGSVVVNGGGATTTSHTVTLGLSATDPGSPTSGVTHMRFSNDGATWSAFQPYAAAAAWTLSGDGTKTVHVQFRDGSGNVSATASDAISLDSTGPRATKLRPGNGAKDVKVGVKIRVKVSEALTVASVTKKTVVLRQKGVGKVKAKVTYLAARNVIKLVPKQPLDPDAKYVLKVRGVKDLVGLVWDQKPAVTGLQPLRSTIKTG